ncbi:hypothetical protein IG631_16043 [Alternaria alternata]|nr:hypothetical protein IG631_16043 [Alternaria alternata]
MPSFGGYTSFNTAWHGQCEGFDQSAGILRQHNFSASQNLSHSSSALGMLLYCGNRVWRSCNPTPVHRKSYPYCPTSSLPTPDIQIISITTIAPAEQFFSCVKNSCALGFVGS